MKFNKEQIEEIMDSSYGAPETNKVVLEEELGKLGSRWYVHHRVIFKHEDKLYELEYQQGATESQDWRFLDEYDDDDVECPEVKEVEVTVKKYVTI